MTTMHSFEYYLGKACRRYRRGDLDMSVSEMLAKSHYQTSKSNISLFEQGKVHSSDMVIAYRDADPSKADILYHSCEKAFQEFYHEMRSYQLKPNMISEAISEWRNVITFPTH